MISLDILCWVLFRHIYQSTMGARPSSILLLLHVNESIVCTQIQVFDVLLHYLLGQTLGNMAQNLFITLNSTNSQSDFSILAFTPNPVAGPVFPMGGVDPYRGLGPPTQVLFAKNVCKNERIGSCRGERAVALCYM